MIIWVMAIRLMCILVRYVRRSRLILISATLRPCGALAIVLKSRCAAHRQHSRGYTYAHTLVAEHSLAPDPGFGPALAFCNNHAGPFSFYRHCAILYQ